MRKHAGRNVAVNVLLIDFLGSRLYHETKHPYPGSTTRVVTRTLTKCVITPVDLNKKNKSTNMTAIFRNNDNNVNSF